MQQEITCPECGLQNPAGQRFCRNCATGLPTRCAKCFTDVPPYSQFCPSCEWKDPNYAGHKEKARSLRKQIAQQSSATMKPEQLTHGKPQYTCPQCGSEVAILSEPCPNCNYLFGNIPPPKTRQPEMPAPQPTGMLKRWTREFPTQNGPVSGVEKAGQLLDPKLQHTCPQCGTAVEMLSEPCPNCNYLFGNVAPAEMQHQAAPAAPVRGKGAPTLASLGSVPSETDQAIRRAPREWGIPQWARQTLAKLVNVARKAARRSRPAPTGWSIPPSTRRLLLRGFWAAVFLAIAGLGSYYAVTRIGDISLPSTSPSGSNIIPTPTPAQTYTLSTNIPQGGGEISKSPENETYTSGSEVTLTAIPAGGYTFDHWGGDASGSLATINITMDSDKSITAYFKPLDATPPLISQVNVAKKTDLAATIRWTTDDPATSQVEYGTTRDYGHTIPSDEELKQKHEVRIPGLEANTKYYFRVKSINESGIEAESHTNTFTTLYAIPVGHEVGNRAPLFGPLREYTDVGNTQSPNNGEMVDLKSFLGKKKVLLDFWSTSCSACIAQFPLIRELYLDENWADSNSEYSDFAVITVCIDGHRTDRIDILRDKYSNPEKFGPFTFPILLDEEGTVKDPYHIWRIPYTVFIDSEGIIRETQIGRFHEREEIESILKELE